MQLIQEINEKLGKHGMQVILGLNVEEGKIRPGRDRYFCDKTVVAEFQLTKEGIVMVAATQWDHFIRKVKEELGNKFYRDNNLKPFSSSNNDEG